MELNSFARIGKGVISKAIGLQKNYTEIIVTGPDVLDTDASGCYDCPYQADVLPGVMSDTTYCADCPKAIFKPSRKIKTIYINEKNRYGYQPTLKSTSIKLLLLYHFLQPDGNGFIKNVEIRDLSLTIGCTTATIRACNKVLQQYGYCYISDSGSYDRCINVLLPEYKNYHKTAAEGGRGYITLSSDMLSKLLAIKYLNPLRLNLKGILEIDNAQTRGSDTTSVVSSYRKLRGFLPRYCKNNIIKAALENDTSLLTTSFTDKGVTFKIRDPFSQRKMRKELLVFNQETIEKHVDELNDRFEKIRDASLNMDTDTSDLLASQLMSKGIAVCDDMPFLSLRLSDYADLAAMSVQYNINLVIDAVHQIYNHYVIPRIPIDNFGALARTFIRNNTYFSLAS